MSRFFEIRVRVLAAIAIGLATALVVHAVTRDSQPSLDSMWRYVTSSSDDGSVVSISNEELPSPADEPAASVRATPTPKRSGALLIDGGDYTGPDDTPTPAVPPTATPSAAPDSDDDDEQGSGRGAGGITVNAPTAASPTSNGEDDFMVGAWTGRGGQNLTLTPPADPDAAWVGGQPRGYAMLYALQPEARAVVEANVAALLGAQIQEPYIGVLVDGTFGKDFGYLRELIQRLNTDGRNLHLALYLANGPAQRRFRNPPYEAPFARTPPEEFRREIRRSNSQAQIDYLNIIADARRLFEYNILTNPNAKNYAVVMLEDNLDRDAFRAMSNLAREQLEAVAMIVRSPCKGCYDGNDDDSLGYPRELHSVGGFEGLNEGDGFTLDGQGFLYPNEVGIGKAIAADQLISLLRSSYQKNLRFFGLWRKTWQGVNDDGLPSEPKNGSYKPSTAEEIEFEMKALRAELPFLNSDDEDEEVE